MRVVVIAKIITVKDNSGSTATENIDYILQSVNPIYCEKNLIKSSMDTILIDFGMDFLWHILYLIKNGMYALPTGNILLMHLGANDYVEL